MDYGRVIRTLSFILVLNLVVALLKGIFGILAGSISMVADAFHSLSDTLSNVVGILSIFLAKKPADPEHPYGHGRYETLGTLLIGGLITTTSLWIIYEGYQRLITSSVPSITGITTGVLCATITINVLVYRYEEGVGRELGSAILIADAAHTKSDVFVSLSVLAGFGAVKLGFPQVDPLIAFGIGVLIGKIGLGIIKDSALVLTDASVSGCEDEVKRIVSGVRGVRGCHNLRCRGKPGEIYGDIHVTVDPGMTVADAHHIATEVNAEVIAKISGMKEIVVHLEPDCTTQRDVTKGDR